MPAKSQGNDETRWDDIRVFLAIHRYQTLAAAAGKLGLDTSTASRRIAAFEAALGVRLFDRGREGLRPTRAAEQMLAAAEAMEAAHARLTRDASEVEAMAEGVVRLSVAPGLSTVFIAPRLAALRAKHPRISIELDSSTRARDLTRHEADLAVRSIRSHGADLITTRLATAPWIVATGAALAAQLGTLKTWTAAPWIAWDRDLASFGPAKWLAQHVPSADVALRTSDFLAQLAAAEHGLGLVLVPKVYLPYANLVPVKFGAPLRASAAAWHEDDLWLVGHRALRDVPRVAAVWSFFSEALRQV